MRIWGTVLVGREETTYIEVILGFRIQGEAWRESLGALEKEASERKKSRRKSRLLECPRVRQKPGLVGASGQLWGTTCAGSGVSGGRLVSSDRASAVNTNRRLEEHVLRQRPSQWKGGLPLSRSLGQALFVHDSLPSAEAAAACSASSFSDWQCPLGPVLLRAWTPPPPNHALASVCLLSARTLSGSHCLLSPSPEIVPDLVPSSVPVCFSTGWYCIRFDPGDSGPCRVLSWFPAEGSMGRKGACRWSSSGCCSLTEGLQAPRRVAWCLHHRDAVEGQDGAWDCGVLSLQILPRMGHRTGQRRRGRLEQATGLLGSRLPGEGD